MVWVVKVQVMTNETPESLDLAYFAHLETLREKRRTNLFRLQTQAADYAASDVPIHILNQIAEQESALRAIETALLAPTPPSVLAAIGPEGQTQLLMQEFRLFRQARLGHDTFERDVRTERQHYLDQWLRRVWYSLLIIGVLLVVIIVLLVR